MRTAVVYSPYAAWMVLFTVLPLVLVVAFAFGSADGGITVANFVRFMDPLFLNVLWRSAVLAFQATVICLLAGFPAAYIIARLAPKPRRLAALLLVLPMWMNFLLRTYAWIGILSPRGLLNSALALVGLGPLDLLYRQPAIVIGMVYNFLPFMILPIYTALSRIDPRVIEAAQDLGADRWNVLRRVVILNSVPGVISGITMVFMPAMSTFVIPALLGGGQLMLIGNLVEQQFLFVGNRYFGSAIAVVMMVLVLLSMTVLTRYEREEHLW